MNKYAIGDKVRIKNKECVPKEFIGKIVTIKEVYNFRGYYSYDFIEYDISSCSEDLLELIEIGKNNDLLNGIVNQIIKILNNK